MEKIKNNAADVQGLAANQEATETGTTSNVQVFNENEPTLWDVNEFRPLYDLVHRMLKDDVETREKTRGKSIQDLYKMNLEEYLSITEPLERLDNE